MLPRSDQPFPVCEKCRSARIEIVKVGEIHAVPQIKVTCKDCGHVAGSHLYGTREEGGALPGHAGYPGGGGQISQDMYEQGPGDEYSDAEDDARIIDVGDDEDYETYDFNDDFDDLFGGPGGMYEMNELRRLAGLEQVQEASRVDHPFGASDYCVDCDSEPCECDPEFKEGNWESRECDGCHGAGCWACDDMGYVDQEIEEGFPNNPEVSGVIGYNIGDEKAFFLMQDILGAVEFGPQDEVLVPVEQNDKVCAELDKHGFELGKDYSIARGLTDDVQNGYNDRATVDGDDFFPGGATSSPSRELGPGAAKQGDNPMRTPMASVKKEEPVYESMKLAYRRFRQK